MKQKVAFVSVMLCLATGIGGIFYPPVASAQAVIPTGCPGATTEGPLEPGTVCPPIVEEENCDSASSTCCGKVETSIIGGSVCNNGGEGGVIFSLLKAVLQILTAGIGIAAVGGIGYGALLYTTSAGKPEQSKKAIGIITNVVIGIIAYMLMFVFLNYLIPGGVF